MRSIFIFGVALFLFAGTIYAQPQQPPDKLWTGIYGGNDTEYGQSVQQTSDGGYIIAGWTASHGAGNNDIFLYKTNDHGNQQWYRTFGGGINDYGYCVQQTSDQGYIIAGSSNSNGAGGYDVFLVKTDSSGNQQWLQYFGGSWDDEGRCVQETSDGGYIIAGYTFCYSVSGFDVYIIKTDALGNQQWSRTFGGSNEDRGYSLQQTSDGGYIIAGYTDSYGAGNYDVYLIKADSLGYQQWYRTIGGSNLDKGYSVQQTTDSGYIITGYTSSFTSGYYDVYLVKTDSLGNQQWDSNLGGYNYDKGYSVQQTLDGGYIIAGYTYSYGNGCCDVYLVKTDSLGNQQWYRTFGGNSYDYGYCVKQTSDDGYAIAGYVDSLGDENYDVCLIKTENETEQISLFVLPVNPPIIIPAGGGSFNFLADITNLNNSQNVFDAWTEVSIPGIIDPRSLRLREGQMIQGYGNMTSTLTQYVPGSAPAGIYTYRGFVGTYPDYVTACDSFTFEKTGVSEGFDKSQSWMVEDWNNESISANPVHFNLLSVSPNPFNEKTVISFQLPAASPVELAIYDISGREVQSLVNGHWSLGKHSVEWDAEGMASGIYLIRMKAGDFSQVQKIVLMK